MNTRNDTVETLVEQTIKVCGELVKIPAFAEYVPNINRKAEALKKSPSAKAALDVLEDLKVIAKSVGLWK